MNNLQKTNHTSNLHFFEEDQRLSKASVPTIEKDQALYETHLALARERFDRQQTLLAEREQRIAERFPSFNGATAQAAGGKHEYYAVMGLGGIFYVFINLTIHYGTNSTFEGHTGGFANLLGAAPGALLLNYAYDDIRNWEATVSLYAINPVSVGADFWGMRGEYIGLFVGGKLAIGGGVAAGRGKFK